MRVLHILYCDFQKVLDYLKMDIEGSEWDSLPNMMDDGILNKVKQLAFEIHLNMRPMASWRLWMHHLKRLERLGFRKWYSHKNPACIRLSKYWKVPIADCIEMVYINTNFLVWLLKQVTEIPGRGHSKTTSRSIKFGPNLGLFCSTINQFRDTRLSKIEKIANATNGLKITLNT